MEELDVIKTASSLVLVSRYLDSWKLSYSASLSIDPRYTHIIHAILGKPRPDTPCPLAVVHIKFTLKDDLREVLSYEIEGERHIYRLRDNIEFDERILDRIIRRKIAIKQSGLIDLSDNYINSRIHEPKYDQDVKDAKDHESKDEEMDAIEQRLLRMFRESDVNHDGSLTYLEFRTLLKTIQKDMRKEEVDLLFTQADVDHNCRIAYEEFVQFAMDVIRRLSAGHEYQDHFEELKDDYKIMLSEELEPAVKALRQAFEAADYCPPNSMGRTHEYKLNYDLYYKCLSSPLANLSREEINMMIALTPMDDDGKFEYVGFEKILYEAMYRVSQGQSLALTSDIEPYLVSSFQAAEAMWRTSLDDQADIPLGRVPRSVLFDALHTLKRLMLNRLQCIIVIGLAVEGDDSLVDYTVFAQRAGPKIRELIHPNHLSRRIRMARTDEAKVASIFTGVDDEAGLENVLLEAFYREDQDNDGVLNLDEFKSAMYRTTLGLTDEQIVSMMAVADENGDGFIDYSEFVRFAVINLVQLKKEDRLIQIAEAKDCEEDDEDENDVKSDAK
ncbi:hypothetical protein THRCLA_00726 [Thraustotheca clavata]|uniref:EF-hand domain-containing protein n=1 Tax=Thraustotheca clavata TaxID=74557 RepID=A0A1W0AAS4_9STRA|nr:hypothetical protein THRCLA_00726 [Thraustotheca clavata]